MLSWNKSFYGSYHTYGHSHGKLKNHPWDTAYEVGVDVNDYRPISYFELMMIFKERKKITKIQ
jgi:calcineurin-like phosphoesterase family protein